MFYVPPTSINARIVVLSAHILQIESKTTNKGLNYVMLIITAFGFYSTFILMKVDRY